MRKRTVLNLREERRGVRSVSETATGSIPFGGPIDRRASSLWTVGRTRRSTPRNAICCRSNVATVTGAASWRATRFSARSTSSRCTSWAAPTTPKVPKAANLIRQKQLQSGGWAIYPGGPPEVSASVKAYLVLKLVGDDPDADTWCGRAKRSSAWAGSRPANSFTRLYLAIFGEYDWNRCPRDSTGDHAAAELVLHQHLRDVVVVAGDPDSR